MPNDVRASDAERESTAETLRTHAAAGRLDPDELEERLERALTAQTRAELRRRACVAPEVAVVRAELGPVAGAVGAALWGAEVSLAA